MASDKSTVVKFKVWSQPIAAGGYCAKSPRIPESAKHSDDAPVGYASIREYRLQRGRLVVDIRTWVDKLQRKFDPEIVADAQMRDHISVQQLFIAMRTLEECEHRRQRQGAIH